MVGSGYRLFGEASGHHPSVSALNHQRYLLGQLAGIEHTLAMLKRNTRLLDLSNRHIFYYDPHVEEYTGFLKILKGWCGGRGRVNKVLNLDFIHTLNGSPCFVQHFAISNSAGSEINLFQAFGSVSFIKYLFCILL